MSANLFETTEDDEYDYTWPEPTPFGSLDEVVDSDDDIEDLFAVDDPGGEVEAEIALAEANEPGLPPPTNHTFPSLDIGYAYAQTWASDHGYALAIRSTKQDYDSDGNKLGAYYGRVVCSHSLKPRASKIAEPNRRRDKLSQREECPFYLIISRVKKEKNGYFTITLKDDITHTCNPDITSSTSHPTHRRLARKSLLAEMKSDRAGGLSPKDFYDRLMAKDPDFGITYQDVKNDYKKLRTIANKGYPDIQALLYKLHDDPEWLFDYARDEAGRCERLVFVHLKSLRFLRLYPTALVLDGTFRTNQFNMTLINIVGITATNETVLLGQCFLSFLEIDDYRWLLKYVKNLYTKLKLDDPKSITTDRELAMVSVIEEVFPKTTHLLCVWHVNKCVQAYCLKYWRQEAGGSQPLHYVARQQWAKDKWEGFMTKWKAVVEAKTEKDYETAWQNLTYVYRDEAYSSIMKYLWTTWIKDDRRKFIYAWTSLVLSFGGHITSRVEGINYAVKLKLKSRRGHILDAIEHFQRYIVAHFNKLKQSLEYDRKHRNTRLMQNHLYLNCHLIISQFALKLVEQERIRVNLTYNDTETSDLQPCSGKLRRGMGLPCQHLIRSRMRAKEALNVSDFHPQWRVNRFTDLPQLHPFDTVLNPTSIPTRYPKEQKRRRGHEKTAVEIQEAAQSVNPATGRQRGTRGRGKTHTQAQRAGRDRGEPAQVVDGAIKALQRQQGIQLLGSLAARGKAVAIPSDEDDEIATTIDLTSPEASPIRPRVLSDLLDELLETSDEDEGSASNDIHSDSDSGVGGGGKVSISQAFEADDWDDYSKVRARKKRPHVEVDDNVYIEDFDL